MLKHILKKHSSILCTFLFFVLIFAELGCSRSSDRRDINNGESSVAEIFQVPLEEICKFPNTLPAKLWKFRSLGNGKWSRWSNTSSDEQTTYGCVGQVESVWLYSNTEVGQSINVEFQPIGSKLGAVYVSLEYLAVKYAKIPNEITERKEYAEFVAKTIEKFLKIPISESLKNKILNPELSKNDNYAEKIGEGYIFLESYPEKDLLIDIRIYASTNNYNKFTSK